MILYLIKKVLIFSFFVACLHGCGGGETRKLTKDEYLLKPRDKVKKDQMAAGGKFLGDLMGRSVNFCANWLDGIEENEITLCENTRYFKGEKSNDDSLANKIA